MFISKEAYFSLSIPKLKAEVLSWSWFPKTFRVGGPPGVLLGSVGGVLAFLPFLAAAFPGCPAQASLMGPSTVGPGCLRAK